VTAAAVERLRNLLEREEALAAKVKHGALKLADGGARIALRIAELTKELRSDAACTGPRCVHPACSSEVEGVRTAFMEQQTAESFSKRVRLARGRPLPSPPEHVSLAQQAEYRPQRFFMRAELRGP
jgi:hypothetical protein